MSDYKINEYSLGHKPGCVFVDPARPDMVGSHRIPIDCVTVDDLWKALEKERKIVADLSKQLVELKARLYDYEHEEGR